jgi:hypothetical protein
MDTRKAAGVVASVIFASLLAAPAGADEWVYRWVDKDGVVQYTQEPPRGLPSEAIKVRKGYSMPAEDATPAPTPAEQDEAKRQEYCAGARKNAALLASDGDINTRDAGGATRLMTADERKAELERTNKAIDLYCSPGAAAAPPE